MLLRNLATVHWWLYVDELLKDVLHVCFHYVSSNSSCSPIWRQKLNANMFLLPSQFENYSLGQCRYTGKYQCPLAVNNVQANGIQGQRFTKSLQVPNSFYLEPNHCIRYKSDPVTPKCWPLQMSNFVVIQSPKSEQPVISCNTPTNEVINETPMT